EVADAGVPRLTDELDTLTFKFGSSLGDIRHPYRKPGRVRHERQVFALGLPKTHGDVRRLDFALRHLALRQPENVSVPGDRAFDIVRRDRDEVDLLDAHTRQATTRTAKRQAFCELI